MTTKLKLVHSGNPERAALLNEVMNDIFHRMPFGETFNLADRRLCQIVKMSLPHKATEVELGMHFMFAVFVQTEDDGEPEMIRMSVFADHEAEADRDEISDVKGNA